MDGKGFWNRFYLMPVLFLFPIYSDFLRMPLCSDLQVLTHSSSETANIHDTVSFLLGLLNTMWLSMTYGKYNSYLLCFYQP